MFQIAIRVYCTLTEELNKICIFSFSLDDFLFWRLLLRRISALIKIWWVENLKCCLVILRRLSKTKTTNLKTELNLKENYFIDAAFPPRWSRAPSSFPRSRFLKVCFAHLICCQDYMRRYSSEAGCLVVSREICFYLICANTREWEMWT